MTAGEPVRRGRSERKKVVEVPAIHIEEVQPSRRHEDVRKIVQDVPPLTVPEEQPAVPAAVPARRGKVRASA